MPLNESCSKDAFSANVAELILAGHEREQALAIAYKTLEKACGGRPAWAQARALLADQRPQYRAGPVPEAALRYLEAKKLKPGFSYLDVWREEHAYAFTVAKVLELDLLDTVKRSLASALAEGTPFEAWAQDIKPTLEQSGWANFGTEDTQPTRLRKIFETNMRTARAAGQYDRVQRTKATHPNLQYLLGPSEHHRPEHEAWDGLILPADDPWWEDHFPPLGWGCKCGVRQLTDGATDKAGGLDEAPVEEFYEWTNPKTGDTEQVPVGVDPGWDYNKGEGRAAALDEIAAEAELNDHRPVAYAAFNPDQARDPDGKFAGDSSVGQDLKVTPESARQVDAYLASLPPAYHGLEGYHENPMARVTLTDEEKKIVSAHRNDTKWPLEVVDPKTLSSKQKTIEDEKVRNFLTEPPPPGQEKYPLVLKTLGGKNYLLDGNHRAAYAIATGQSLTVRVIDASAPLPEEKPWGTI